MGKFEKKRKKKKSAFRPVLIGIVLAAILIAAALFVMPKVLYRLTESPEETEELQTEQIELPENKQPENIQSEQTGIENAITFPMILEDGKLEVESLFQYSGINPDCANQDGDDIAAILVRNTSETYLETAEMTVMISDGTKLNFKVMDLPAGTSAAAFSTENATAVLSEVCTEITCSATFDPEASLEEECISVSVSGMDVMLTNKTDKNLSNLVIYCRSPFGEEYFGGLAYNYPVTSIPANGSTTVKAVDCILGVAEVVRIEINN